MNAVSFENYPSHSTQVSTAMCSLNKHLKEESKIKINIHSHTHISSFKHKNISSYKGTMHHHSTKCVLKFVTFSHRPNNMKPFHWIRVAQEPEIQAKDSIPVSKPNYDHLTMIGYRYEMTGRK